MPSSGVADALTVGTPSGKRGSSGRDRAPALDARIVREKAMMAMIRSMDASSVPGRCVICG
jgi:hypothetical protein